MFFLALSSCSQYLYTPSSLNMPLASNKGEIKGSVSVGTGGIEMQGSYCIDSHFVVCITGTHGDQRFFNTLGNVACGYYKTFSGSGRFEILGGLGYGYTHFGLEYLTNPATLVEGYCQYPLVFAQADWGYVKNHVELGFGIRGSEIFNFGSETVSIIGVRDSVYSKITTSLVGQSFYLEPGLMASFGGKNVKVRLAAGVSQLISTEVLQHRGPYYIPAFGSFGVTFNLFRKI
jgi:hypothetical protein